MKYFQLQEISLPLSSIAPRSGDSLILHSVSLGLDQGEILGILGPTGCGKTLLLKTIAGLTRPYQGSIYLDGLALDELKPSERGISLVFQDYVLYPHLTSGENIRFPLFKKNTYQAHPQARVDEIARLLELDRDRILERLPRNISGGEKQRVAIGKAIAVLPTLALLDEPLYNVDEQLRFSLRHSIRHLLKENKITALYVSHNQMELAEVADRIAVMYQGRIEQIGTYRELYDDPKRYFVSLFMGEHSTSYLTAEEVSQLSRGKLEYALTIRPHECQLSEPEQEHFCLRGEVVAIENHLNEHLKVVYIEYFGRLFGVETAWDYEIEKFTPAALYLPLNRARFFDSEGDRIYNLWP